MAIKKIKKTKTAKKPAKSTVKKTVRKAQPKAKKAPSVRAAAKPAKRKGAALDAEHQVPGGVLLGRVEDYFGHVGVVAVTLKAPLSVGDMIRIKGHTTDITQKVESMQIEHQSVQAASPKDALGIRVADRARKGDAVYKI